MTLEGGLIKTNQFEQRRKLRLQQVREQSKDIAQKIRHRAKVLFVENKKEKYFECQEKFVNRLEQIYAQNLKDIGHAHKSVAANIQDDFIVKRDLSKRRGKEAAADLKRRKQQKLDAQKKILDRKLKAREAANEYSREKSSQTIKKITKENKHCEEEVDRNVHNVFNLELPENDQFLVVASTNDIATQWESPVVPNPTPEYITSNESIIDKNKKLNLFALSDEMTLNMNDALSKDFNQPSLKPSLTLVSEYIQNRSLRLRQPELTSKKKRTEDLQNIKQTILRTRATETANGKTDTVCHPIPSWNVESSNSLHSFPSNCLSFCRPPDPISTPKSKSPNAMRHQKSFEKAAKSQKSLRSIDSSEDLDKKSSVTVYNHTTRDLKYLPCGDSQFVYRETTTDDDAYAKAFKETSVPKGVEQERLNKQQQEMRNKVAIKKQNVDKEYKETLSFLNSLPKEVNSSSMTTAFVDEDQQRIQRERHQYKLQEEFKKAQKESCIHNCKRTRKKVVIGDRSRSKSPITIENKLKNQKFQYSWMPVPESDGSLAIHTVPNTAKDKGEKNTVKFSQINSYHEYRSRHKHTPPTRDTSDRSHKVVETLVVEHNDSTESNESYTPSETSSVTNLNLEKNDKDDGLQSSDNLFDSRLSEADRILVYKILNTKKKKHGKERGQLSVKNLKQKQQSELSGTTDENGQVLREFFDNIQNGANHAQIKEGVYKAVNSNNGENIEACYTDSIERENDTTEKEKQICRCDSSRNKKIETPKDADGDIDRNKGCCDNCKKSLNKSDLTKGEINVTKDANILKLIDDAGQESSKFYIGASGFLKDNNYEVIIQLRKKDSDMTETKSQPVQTAQGTAMANNSCIKTPTLLDKGILTSNESENKPNDVGINTSEDQRIENNEEVKCVESTETSLKARETKSTDKLNTTDKGISTSFQTSFVSPDQISETDTGVRPATSTYTQTNFSSQVPVIRPPFMHMSSSTSTAYLSPPEIILPRFLRQEYDITSEDIYNSSNSNGNQTQQFKLNEHLRNSSTDDIYKKCRCTKIDPKKKVLLENDVNIPKNCVCVNSLRSTTKCKVKDLQYRKPQSCHKHKKCRSRSETSSYKYKNSKKRPSSNTAESLNVAARAVSARLSTKLKKSKLDPELRKYVNTLLSINKESLKAVDIINQDCSDVSTPSNSVINVPSNFNKLNPVVDNTISLEQIKNVLKHKIINENSQSSENTIKQNQNPMKQSENKTQIPKKTMQSVGRKRSIHKVKSLNIPKRLLKNNSMKLVNSEPSNSNCVSNKICKPLKINNDVCSTAGNSHYSKSRNQTSSSLASVLTKEDMIDNTSHKNQPICGAYVHEKKHPNYYPTTKNLPFKNEKTSSFVYSDSDLNDGITSFMSSCKTSFKTITQRNEVIVNDIDYMKIAEDKLQNMEKIADLTEKCTKRLSNLAKILEEVRRNKSLVYSQISSNEVSSGSDNKSDKSSHKNQNISQHSPKEIVDSGELLKNNSLDTKETQHDFVQLLKDIPKPDVMKSTSTSTLDSDNNKYKPTINNEEGSLRCRTKPPPALPRHLKCGPELLVTPHELSTVVEVDSPMSIKTKRESSRQNIKYRNQEKTIIDKGPFTETSYTVLNTDINKKNSLKNKSSKPRTDSPANSKLQMMDMKQFNDIMLKPFISLQEYAKQYKIDGLEEGSGILEEILKEQPFNEVISNSENSLPDVMTELLKRNMISEPFKFDTGSNNNSSCLSSESTLSTLALSKQQRKKKSEVKPKQQNSLVDTSETLSVSSNPDLENAFQKLGMGWASSTLKKTKERLALTSSSSSSSSSRKLNIKSFNLEIPELATDSMSSLMTVKDDSKEIMKTETSLKNAVQQTSPKNSMTVKEFLNKELSKKITFTNSKSRGADDFLSLYDTKMPEEMKNANTNIENEHSQTSVTSPNNRARTSTPVQLFKCTSYRTSSSSNTSNCLFSNADDLSSVKGTSNSFRNHSTSDKEDLTIPTYSLKLKTSSDVSKSE